ncbi:tetratricopeptide repeat protein [Terrarubrum flagellatum]|uniref:tetratricopeptide repeat protein n=1 Tax=Terrirubrum flagellatum TaxID=2895980 RepID=UPI00314544A7
MSDIFREIDEDLRRERMGLMWKKYGGLIVGAAFLLVLATAGWRGWQYWQGKQAQEAGGRFEKALELSRDGKDSEAEKAFVTISADAPAGYRILARLRGAAELSKIDPDSGIAAWRAIAADSGVGAVTQDLARVRVGYLLLDKAAYADLAKEMEPIAVPSNPWRNEAREILGASALKASDLANAGKWFDQIVSDRDAPPGIRQRAEAFLGFVAGGPARTQ